MQNWLDDYDRAEKQALVHLHILPSQYEEEDFYVMNRVLAVSDEKEEHVDPTSLVTEFDEIDK